MPSQNFRGARFHSLNFGKTKILILRCFNRKLATKTKACAQKVKLWEVAPHHSLKNCPDNTLLIKALTWTGGKLPGEVGRAGPLLNLLGKTTFFEFTATNNGP